MFYGGLLWGRRGEGGALKFKLTNGSVLCTLAPNEVACFDLEKCYPARWLMILWKHMLCQNYIAAWLG